MVSHHEFTERISFGQPSYAMASIVRSHAANFRPFLIAARTFFDAGFSSSISPDSPVPFSTTSLDRSVASSTQLHLNDGNSIPLLGLGTWKSPPGQVGSAVEAAVDAGYRHIDCALVYRNEEEVGAALAKKIAAKSLVRDDVFLTGKIWNTFHSADKTRRGLQLSLKALRIDYLDLLLIHYPMGWDEGDEGNLYPKDQEGKLKFSQVDYLETYSAMERLRSEGLVRSIGLSNFNSSQVARVLTNCSVTPAVNQVEVHPYFANEKLVRFCRDKDVAVAAYSPLGSPDRPNANPSDPILLEDPVVVRIAESRNKTSAQVLIRFCLQRGLVVLPKSVTPTRIAANAAVFDFVLDEAEMAALAALDKGRLGRTCASPDSSDHPLWPFADEF